MRCIRIAVGLGLVLLVLVLPAQSHATKGVFPCEFCDNPLNQCWDSIQEAIDNTNWEPVHVCWRANVYDEELTLKAGVSVICDVPPCTLHGGQTHRLVRAVDPAIGRDTVLTGFVLQAGRPDADDPLDPEQDDRGGGIYIDHGASPTIKDNTIKYSFAVQGAGIYVGPGCSPAILDNDIESNCQYDEHPAGVCDDWDYDGGWGTEPPYPTPAGGGGLFVDEGAVGILIQRNTFLHNGAETRGGGAYLHDAQMTFGGSYEPPDPRKGNDLTWNIAGIAGASGSGAGIFADSANGLEILDNDFDDNEATYRGGAIYATSMAQCLFQENWLSGNTSQNGAGMYLYRTGCTISGNVVYLNVATTNAGGIYVERDHTGGQSNYIDSNSIYVNTATNGRGGGIYASYAATPTFTTNYYYSNTSGSDGGAVRSYGGSPTIKYSSFFYNDSGGHGGAIALGGPSSPSVRGNYLYYNSANSSGGGVAIQTASASLIWNELWSNEASTGGGVAISSALGEPSSRWLDGNLIRSNAAATGGGVYISGATARLTNNRVCLNAAGSVQGIYIGANSAPHIVNNVVVNNPNLAPGAGIGIGLSGVGSAAEIVNTILVRNTGWGIHRLAGNGAVLNSHNLFFWNQQNYDLAFDTSAPLVADPLFDGGPAGCEYAILPNSPARDSGEDEHPSNPPTDYFGTQRPQGAHYDRGVHEVLDRDGLGDPAEDRAALLAVSCGTVRETIRRAMAKGGVQLAREADLLLARLVVDGLCELDDDE